MKRFVMFIATLIFFASVGFLMATFVMRFVTVDLSDAAWLFVFTVISYYLAIVTHEAGHLIFGKLSGFRFLSFRFLSFMIQKEADGHYRFKRYALHGTAGQCLMIPPQNKPMPIFWYNAGGVIMNALWVFFSLLVLIHQAPPFLILFFVPFGLINLFVLILNGIPFKGISNDANNTLEALRNPRSREAYAMLLNTHAQLTYGERFSAMSLSETNPKTLELTRGLQLNEYLLRTTQALYQGHLEDYVQRMKGLKEHTTNQIFAGLLKPYSHLAALLSDPMSALEHTDKATLRVIKAMKYEGLFALILWYQAHLQKDEKTPKIYQRFIDIAKKQPLKGEIEDLLNLQETLSKTSLEHPAVMLSKTTEESFSVPENIEQTP